jgi:hypothetical protein
MPTIPRHIVAAISGLLLGLIAAVLAAPTAFAHRPPDEGNSAGLTAVDVHRRKSPFTTVLHCGCSFSSRSSRLLAQ